MLKGNGYVQYEFNKELFDIFKIVDFSISRAGANSIYEFLALNIPFILIPLEKNQMWRSNRKMQIFSKK